ncbi:leucine-rich repeat protein [Lysinibacillus xylanilyticus]|uniref:leucine-rich repeat protein n=1 Tax=Lysinibacillus xylanilyticus TaxID=582475 RepID=UPI003D03F350
MGKNKKNKVISFATAVAVGLPAVVAGVPSAHAAETGTYQGVGYTASYEATDGGVRMFNFKVTDLKGIVTIKLPASIEGQKVVSIENKSLEKVSRRGVYEAAGGTGSFPKTNYLGFVEMPNADVKLEYQSNPFSAQANMGVVFKTTLENGVNMEMTMDSSKFSRAYTLSSDNTAKPIRVDTFNVPETFFGVTITNTGEFKGLDIGTAHLPSTITVLASRTFSNQTTVNYLDLTNLTNIKEAPGVIAKFKGDNSYLKVGNELLRARGQLGYYVDSNIDTIEIADNVKDFYSDLFKNTTYTTKRVILPEGLENILYDSFKGLIVKEPIVFPSTLKTIGDRAFESTSGVIPDSGQLVLPEGLESVGARAFYEKYYNSPRGSLVLPKSLVSIGTDAFVSKFSNVIVLNKYMKYPTGNLPIGLTPTGVIRAVVGSTTETVYAGKGFIPLDENLKEPTITSSLVDGQTYKGDVTPTFTVQNADKVTYTLDGKTYDGASKITGGGQHKLDVVGSNSIYTTKKSFTFNIALNNAPVVVGSISDKKIKKGDVLTVNLNPLFNDANGDKLSFEATTSDDYASEVWVNAKGELKFTSTTKDSYDVSVRATDGTAYSEPITFKVDVGDGDVVTPPVEPLVDPKPPVVEDNGQVGEATLKNRLVKLLMSL